MHKIEFLVVDSECSFSGVDYQSMCQIKFLIAKLELASKRDCVVGLLSSSRRIERPG